MVYRGMTTTPTPPLVCLWVLSPPLSGFPWCSRPISAKSRRSDVAWHF